VYRNPAAKQEKVAFAVACPFSCHPVGICFGFAVLVVILGEDLFLFVAFAFIFCIFCPKIACQALPSPNHLKINNIRVAF
jgi:hypothetical protein